MGATPLRDEDLIACAKTTIRIKAKQIVQNNGTRFGDKYDVEQELKMYLLSRKHKYDPKRGALSTFVAMVITSCVREMFRKADQAKRKPPTPLRSLDKTECHSDGDEVSRGELLAPNDGRRRLGTGDGLLADVETKAAFNEAMATLPPRLREVADRLKWQSEAAVARAMSVSKQWIRSAREQIRLHFEKHGLGISQEPVPGARANGISNKQTGSETPDGENP
ncbi:MAG: sigma-70 family RNA polymerase sigma factor [Planctomycetes bacterium]|nr:sigma-70 family RNA polymerase sigma factor [Planctomycetota bacterium]